MDSIVIQFFLFHNYEYNKINNKKLKIILQHNINKKIYMSIHKINNIIYIDILYNKLDNSINKNLIINILKKIYPSISRLYITILERPTIN